MPSSPLIFRLVVVILFQFLLFLGVAEKVFAVSLESFLEPNKHVDIVPASRDTIRTIHVKEGEQVKKGQLLVTLDLEVLFAHRNTAKILAGAHGRIDSASTVIKMRQNILNNLQRLETTGHVRPNELEKAETDLAIARSDLLAAKEERLIRKAELKQIEAQIAQKKIKSPISGVVSRIYKTEGELVGVSDGDSLITIVQTRPLHAVFHIPYGYADRFPAGREVLLGVDGFDTPEKGVVAFASPIVNPESGTVRVKVDLSESFDAKSGIRCSLDSDRAVPQ